MSVTIRPSGDAYHLARDVIDALGQQCPSAACGQDGCAERACAGFEPHVTLQYVYEVPSAEVDRVADMLEQLFRDARPVPIAFGAVGTFPGVPGVHVDVEPAPELIELYVRTKRALEAFGQRTYEYDSTSWRPHLTLSCRHWTGDAVERIRQAFPRLPASFLADRVQINRLEGERWIVLRDVPLRTPAGEGVGMGAGPLHPAPITHRSPR
jgi:2'-5' RNA ligase